MVWVVVNTKFLIVKVFKKKYDANTFANKLRDLESENFGNSTWTICVHRDIVE